MKCEMWVVKCEMGARPLVTSEKEGRCNGIWYVGVQGYYHFKKKWKTHHIANSRKTLTIRKTHLRELEQKP